MSLSLCFKSPLLCAVLFVAVGSFVATPAQARTHHHKISHHKIHHVTAHKKAINQADTTRQAQRHLNNLGYDPGAADGKMGKKTRAAIRSFQLDHHLTATGTLTTKTYSLLASLDMPNPVLEMSGPAALSHSDFYGKNPDFYGHVNPQYADAMQKARGGNDATGSATQTLPSRYGLLEAVEQKNGDGNTSYSVTLGGQPLVQADNQPAVIGISQTYSLESEDLILLTTYRALDPTCPYKHQLLIMKNGGHELRDIDECTSGYQAKEANGSLYIVFPQETNRAVGSTWRYDNGALNKL